jgi:type I restriction-modification system DNA methylase subunit
MVELTEPTPSDLICDPAAGTCGFLVAAGEYLRHKHPEVLRDPKLRKHFHEKMFNGAGVIVPDGVLFGSSKAHKDLRVAS